MKPPNKIHRKLSATQVRSIRVAYKKGGTLRSLARVNGVSHETIRNILRGKSWAWLEKIPGEWMSPKARPRFKRKTRKHPTKTQRAKARTRQIAKSLGKNASWRTMTLPGELD